MSAQGSASAFFAIFTKRNNFYVFKLAFLDDVALPYWGILCLVQIKKKVLSYVYHRPGPGCSKHR